jgi:probable HAF family extracellular repeat protein
MKFKVAPSVVVAVSLLSALILSTPSAAQEHKRKLSHYTLTDLGTLGGSFSFAGGLSNSGWVEGYAYVTGDTAAHAFLWRHGKITDLGTLGGPSSDASRRPNNGGNAAGGSDTATSDPLGEDFCGHGTYMTCLPFMWRHDKQKMTALPILGNNGWAGDINAEDEVVGVSENGVMEPTCMPPQVMQSKPVMWRKGKIQELPTVAGDPVGEAFAINDRSEAVGWSGDCQMPLHGVLWKYGKATDLGNLGGVLFTQAVDINNWGQVVGTSDLTGDSTNDGFLWQRGVITDLGTLPGDAASTADGINDFGQIVGGSTDPSGNTRAYIWQDGVMADLNTLIPANSSLFLQEATGGINDWGQIAGIGVDSIGDTHAFLLTPTYCDKDDDTATPAASTRPNANPGSNPPALHGRAQSNRFNQVTPR